MSQQTIFRRQAATLILRGVKRGDRQRPLSCLVGLDGDLTPTANNSVLQKRSFHQQAVWTRRSSSAARNHLSSLDTSVRWFSSGEDEKKEEEESKAAAEAPPAGGDKKKKRGEIPEKFDPPEDCPTWQNPLHHADPDKEKFLESDFGPDEEIEYTELPPLADPNDPDKVLASQKIYDLADEIVHLSMLEMNELVDKIGDYFEFEKPPFTGPGGGVGGGGDDEDEEGGEEEAAAAKTAFDLKLTGFDAKSKIKVIKEVRAVANLGLKEAKEMVESAPKVVMKDINKEMAEELKEKLEAVGAEVEIV